MADYKLTLGTEILKTAEGITIPNNPANEDRQKYDLWVVAGGTPDPAETFEERRTRHFADLKTKTSLVSDQGVDGPPSVGTVGDRSWPTNDDAKARLSFILRGKEREAAAPGSGLTSPYTLLTRTGELGGVNNTTLETLEGAMFTHQTALEARAKTVWLLIRDATDDTEMDTAEAAIQTGWPALPVNP